MKDIQPKITNEQFVRFQKHMQRVPGDELLEYAKSKTTKRIMKKYGVFEKHPLFLNFYKQRAITKILGQAFEARFKTDGDFLLELQNSGKINEFGRLSIEVLLDYYQDIFYLSKAAWSKLKPVLDSTLYLYIQDEIELLAMIIHEQYESHYESCVDGYSYTHKEIEQETRELKVMLMERRLENNNWAEDSLLLRFPPVATEYKDELPTRILLYYVIGVCEEAAKTDLVVQHKLRKLGRSCADLCDHMSRFARNMRQNNKSMSIKWQDGLQFKGCKGGWIQNC